MRFVLEAWRARRRRLQLQQLLLLAVRCLIPVVLGLALAQPLLSNDGLFGTSGTIVHLVIDNSMASGGLDDTGETPLDRHQAEAYAVIESLNQGDEVGVIPLSQIHQRHSIPAQRDHSAVREGIKRITTTHGPANLSQALDEVARRITSDTSQSHRVVLLSEFREGSGRIDEPLPPDLFQSDRIQLEYTAPATTSIEQVRIIDVTPLRRLALRQGGVESLASQSLVRLERDGEQLPETTTTLTAMSSSGRQTSRQVNWQGGVRDVVVDFLLPVDVEDGGVSPIRIEVGVAAPAQQRHLLVEMQDVLRVVILDRERLGRDQLPLELDSANWLQRALRPTTELPIEIRNIDPAAIVSGDLLDVDAVFLLRPDLLQTEGWRDIEAFHGHGGLVMVMPPGDRAVHGWTDTMIETMNLDWSFSPETQLLDPPEGLVVTDSDDSVLRIIGAELPNLLEPVEVHQILEVDPGLGGSVSLRTDTGRPLLVTESKPGRGTLLLLTTSPRLDWTSLPAKPLMVPLIQESLRGGLHLGRGKQSIVVGRPLLQSEQDWTHGELRHPDGTSILLDDSEAVIDRPGSWLLIGENGVHDGRIVANVDPTGGDLDRQSAEAVEAWLAETGSWSVMNEQVKAAGPGRSLVWILLSILAVLLVLESLLSRWFSPRGTDAMSTIGYAGATS